ncbi:hypothetical protein D1872_166600 [compost metagenome]
MTPSISATRARSPAGNWRGLITSSGRNVARPARRCFRRPIAWRPTASFSTTTCCRAPPNAISIAVSYCFSTDINSATAPSIPAKPCSRALRISFTPCIKPEKSACISFITSCRERRLFSLCSPSRSASSQRDFCSAFSFCAAICFLNVSMLSRRSVDTFSNSRVSSDLRSARPSFCSMSC